MWYKYSFQKQNKEVKQQPKPLSPDDKIVLAVAEQLIRERMYFKGNYNPDMRLVTRLSKKILEQIEGKHSDIRNANSKESLTPVIKSFVDALKL